MEDLKSCEFLLEKFYPSLAKNDNEVLTRREALDLIKKVSEQVKEETIKITEEFMDGVLYTLSEEKDTSEYFRILRQETSLIIK